MLGEDTMLFASYATGYKGQAFDVTTGFDETKAENPVAPETSESIELGMKGTFWDRRLRLNAAARPPFSTPAAHSSSALSARPRRRAASRSAQVSLRAKECRCYEELRLPSLEIR